MNVKKKDRPDREADLVLEINAKEKGRRKRGAL